MRSKSIVYLFFVFAVFNGVVQHSFAQTEGERALNLKDLETLFFQNNYQIMAAKYEVDKAEAAVLQGKLWQNPTLSISQINFWSNSTAETLPNIIGNYGSRQQINLELEQMIETANKRKRRIAYLSSQKEGTVLQLEETVRNLRLELQNAYIDFSFAQQYQEQLDSVLMIYTQLSKDLKTQVQKQLLPQSDFYRIHAAVIDLRNQSIENQALTSSYLDKIKLLTFSSQLTQQNIAPLSLDSFHLSQRIPENILNQAFENNIELKIKNKEIDAAEQSVLLEKANRFPDVNILFNYDRGGNIMRNFVGFGLGFDIPAFNRNQGNLKIAKYTNEQLVLSKNETLMVLQQEVTRIQNQIKSYEDALTEITEHMLPQQQTMIQNYSKHMLNKQISLLEFIDFSEAFLEAQQSLLLMKSNYLKSFNELKLITGQDL